MIRAFFRRHAPDIAILLLLFLLPLVFFFPVTVGGKTLIPADNLYQYEPWAAYRAEQGVPDVPHNGLLSDLVLQNYQWKTFIRQNIDSGEIPLWQPNQFAGTPFLANGQHSALYPFSIIYYVLPLESAYGWFTVSQLWLAGVMMMLFIRGLGLGRAAGVVGAVAYQLSGFMIVATVHPMIQAGAAWLPLLLLMVEFSIQGRSLWGGENSEAGSFNPLLIILPWTLIGAVGLGMSFLAGHIEITYYSLLVMAIYAALRLIAEVRRRHIKTLIPSFAMLLLMVALGFGVGASQFIPLIETANNSFRTERSSLDEVLNYALPPRHVALWGMPNFYGNPAHHGYFDVFEMENVSHDWDRDSQRITHTDFGIKNYVEGGAYVGILTLVLAFIGFMSGYKQPHRLIFAFLGLMSLAFMFGTPAYAILYYLFPGVDQLHTPFRWIWIFTIVLCVLAAYGTEALQNRHPLTWRGGRMLVGLGVLILAGLIASRLFYGNFAPLVERIYDGLSGANLAFPDARSFYSYQFRNVLIFGLMLVASGGVIEFSRRSGSETGDFNPLRFFPSVPLWQIGAVVVIALDLFLATGDFNPAAEKAWLEFTPPSITWLQDRMTEDGPFRIQAFNWGEEPLVANAGWRYGLHDVRGYDSLFSKQYSDFMGEIKPQHSLDFNRIKSATYDNPRVLLDFRLDLLNVRYIITDWIIRPAEEFGVNDLAEVGLKEVYTGSGVRIYENLDALPRAYGITGEKPEIDTLQREAIIPATITRYENTTVLVEIQAEEPAWLVLGDTYNKGWRAFVRPHDEAESQEKEIPVEMVMENFRGVQVEPGAWTVRFRYSPQSFQLGAFTSFVSGMLVIFLALIWLWQTFIGTAADEDSARRVVKNSLAPIFLNLFNRGIDFAFAFIMLRILAPEGAGIYYYAVVIFGWFDILTNFGLNTLLTREVSRDHSRAWNYLINTGALRIALAGIGIPLLAGFLILRNATVTPPLDETAIIAIILLYVGLIPNSITTGLTALFYAFEKAEYPAALATISTLIKVSVGLGTLLMGWGVIGLAGTSILTNTVTLILMGRLALPLLRSAGEAGREISSALMREMMGESWPLMLNHLLATIFFKSDVILLEAIKGVTVVGIYSTAYRWLDGLNIIPAFFTMALLPLMSRQAHEDKQGLRRNYIFGFKSLVIVALPVAVLMTFMAHTLIGLLGGAKFLPDGAIALQIMIWSIPVGWINSLTQYVLIALDRQRQITFAFVAAVSFNIIGNLIFVPRYSFRAAAVTTILSELALLIGFYALIRLDLGQINFARVLWRPVLAVTVMLIWLAVAWNFSQPVAILASGVIYVAVLVALKPLSPEEGERMERVLPARLRRLVVR